MRKKKRQHIYIYIYVYKERFSYHSSFDFNLEMASVLNSTLFFIVFLFIIINSIHGYRLNEQIDTSDVNDDLMSYNRINLRSVLWPKICFTTLHKKNEHQYPNGQYHHHLSKRNARKCYPFDTV